MEKNDAMNYEYLIRRAHKCGRFGVEGANADTFRHLSMAEIRYRTEKENIAKGKSRETNAALDELAFDYGSRAGKVAAYIGIAIEKVLKDHNAALSESQKEELENCKVELISPSIKTLYKVIAEADAIMLNIGLYP